MYSVNFIAIQNGWAIKCGKTPEKRYVREMINQCCMVYFILYATAILLPLFVSPISAVGVFVVICIVWFYTSFIVVDSKHQNGKITNWIKTIAIAMRKYIVFVPLIGLNKIHEKIWFYQIKWMNSFIIVDSSVFCSSTNPLNFPYGQLWNCHFKAFLEGFLLINFGHLSCVIKKPANFYWISYSLYNHNLNISYLPFSFFSFFPISFHVRWWVSIPFDWIW